MPTPFERAFSGDYYRKSIERREPVSSEPWRSEPYHSAPVADPARYRDAAGVMLTFPVGRLFTVARPELLEEYRSPAGLTVLRHYTLNEDNHDASNGRSDVPFDGQVGYVAVDVDRAGPHVRLMGGPRRCRRRPDEPGNAVQVGILDRGSPCSRLRSRSSLAAAARTTGCACSRHLPPSAASPCPRG